MPKLTDTQLVILSAAAQRKDGAVLPLPKSLKIRGSAVAKTLIGLRKNDLLEEKPAALGSEAWRETKNGRRMMLVITGAGLQAIDSGANGEAETKSASKKPPPKKRRGHGERKPTAVKLKSKTVPAARQGTKQTLLINLLKRKRGATISDIVQATGWQPHSVRGAISGTLKKKLGLAVSSEKVDGRGRVYRIIEHG